MNLVKKFKTPIRRVFINIEDERPCKLFDQTSNNFFDGRAPARDERLVT